MKVFAVRDIIILTSQGLNGGLTVIYSMAILGADGIAIGILGSVNAVVGTCFTLVGGWMGDLLGRKKMFLLGSAITILNPLVYTLAPSWRYLLIVNITGPVGDAIAGPAGFSIRMTSVDRSSLTRATAALYTAHSFVNMVVPPIGSVLVALSGSLKSLRTIYAIESCMSFLAWLYTAKKLNVVEPNNEVVGNERPRAKARDFFNYFQEIYRISRSEGTWPFLLLAATSPWVFNVDGNFQTVYANSICQSPLIVIGLLSSINSLVAMLLYIPIANMAEKKGRMNAVVMIRPIQYLGQAIYILAGTFFTPGITPYVPFLVWGLRAAGGVGGPGWEVASIEGVPPSRLSTWMALQNFTSRLVGIPAPLVGGILWNIDPRAPFIWHLSIDAAFRLNIMRKLAKIQ